ncbi:MAG: amidase family protein [Actinomycetota bacterium]|nr:amidase family protein [Actinomycetota bacterium]
MPDLDAVLAALAADPHNAVVHLDPDHARAQRPGPGPLHGVPVAVKDLIDVAGLPTSCGSAVLAGAPPASTDAPVVAALRAAGAVVVAKTHTHEFAYGPTGDVAVQGPCRNPHDPTRITGGSSGGSAAALAAGLVPLALGTDTGCSVRTPAALCGVVGLKPGVGVLPAGGVFPLSETCDHVGLLGIDVPTVAAGFAALTGTAVDPGVPPVTTTVGLPTDSYWRVHDPAITAAVAAAADALGRAGATVREVRMPGIDELAATYRPIVGTEAYATHRRWLAERPQDYQPSTRERLLAAADLTAADYVTAQRTRRRVGAQLLSALDGIDMLLTPTTPLRATPIGATHVEIDGTTVEVRGALLSLTLPFSLLGLPAVSVPVPGVPGLPVGVQVVALHPRPRDGWTPSGGEQTVLAAAAHIVTMC